MSHLKCNLLGLCLSLAFLVCNIPKSHTTLSLISNSSIPFCHNNDHFALLDFKNSLAIDISASLDCSYDYYPSSINGQVGKAKTKSWKMETNCCEWDGVTCHPSTAHVIALDLSCAQLSGTIGPNSTLFRLHHLQTLNLAFNDFYNSYISPKYGLFQHLTHLNLSSSGFQGKVPSEIFHLKKLSSFDLSFNYGLELSNFVDLVENLTALTQLALDLININSSIPQSLVNRSSLTLLSLSDCSLQGKLPSKILELPYLQVLNLEDNTDLHMDMQLGNWSNSLEVLNLNSINISSQLPYSNGGSKPLRKLQLYGCNMYGAIPPWVWNISEVIYLGDNQLTGCFPSKLPNVLSLKALDLNSNNLRGNVELNMFSPSKNLKSLDLSNNGLTVINRGSHELNSTLFLPYLEFLYLSSCNMSEFPSLNPPKYLRWLDFSSNNIQGKIPMWLHAIGTNSLYFEYNVLNISHNYLTHGINHLPWKNFDVVDISSNMLQESIPIFSSNLTKLGELYASNNKLNGIIHPSICNLTRLSVLDLSNNTLTGEIPLCLENLSVVNLKSNKLNGTLQTIMFSNCNSLAYLDLSDNQLQGVVPRSLSQCQSLNVLNLGNNKFNGTFPSWLESLPQLQILSLRYNNLQGRLISSSEVKEPFPMLQIIDLSNNKLFGKLPIKYIKHFTAMINMNESTLGGLRYMESLVYTSTFTYSIELTYNGRQQPYVKIISTMSTFDLSNNKFEGEIPDSIGKLHSLRGLNLSHNLFTGPIPSSIGNLYLLGCLDLSSNRLTGHIPQELASLTSLGVFNVSENLLEGPIPHGKQFDTFPLESYIGNLGLCGLPLPECGGSHSPSSDNSENNHEDYGSISLWEIVIMGFGSGVVVGLAWSYYMFSVGKPFWFIRLANKMETALLDVRDEHFARRARTRRN